jgi:tripartite-type tricarboxylate transporter receptor subunit TctC
MARLLSSPLAAVTAVLSIPCWSVAAAAQAYPAKPITLVAPQAVGGAADLAARAFAVVASKHIGQPVRVVNKPGGAGVPGVMAVKTAGADGYTLLAAMSPFVVSAPVFRKSNPYKTFDLDYLAILEEQPLTLAVAKASPYKDAKAFLSAAKSTPSPIKIAVAAKIGLATLSFRAMAKDLGGGEGKFAPTPYKSGPAAARGLLAGDVQIASINLASINAALKSGDARLLMVTSDERNPAYPSVPTARELNLPSVDGITLWIGLAGPKGLPKSVHAKWEEALPKIFADPMYVDLLAKRGAEKAAKLGKATVQMVKGQLASYEKLKASLGD